METIVPVAHESVPSRPSKKQKLDPEPSIPLQASIPDPTPEVAPVNGFSDDLVAEPMVEIPGLDINVGQDVQVEVGDQVETNGAGRNPEVVEAFKTEVSSKKIIFSFVRAPEICFYRYFLHSTGGEMCVGLFERVNVEVSSEVEEGYQFRAYGQQSTYLVSFSRPRMIF